MKGYQTPQQDQLRSPDLANRRPKDSQSKSKKPQTTAKKSLNAEFKSVSGDFSPEIIKEAVDFSSISEISDGFLSTEITESFALASSPPLVASPKPFSLSDLTPSSTISINKNESDHSMDQYLFNRSDVSKIGSLEVDLVVNLLKEARNQVLNSIDTDARSKRLLDALINLIANELYEVPEQRDRCTELVLIKTRIVFTCFLIWILAVSVILFFNLGPGSCFIGPLPT